MASLTFSTVENENSSSSANKNNLNDSVLSVSNTIADSQFQKMEADTISIVDSVHKINDATKEVVTPKVKYSWFGKCTHYHDKYVGRHTSSGDIFSQHKLTAASTRGLPNGTKVRVTNLDNNKSVIVKINDTGKFNRNNLDLSKSAYFAINIKGKDLFNVKFEVLGK
jgi:rare lipoprotein A